MSSNIPSDSKSLEFYTLIYSKRKLPERFGTHTNIRRYEFNPPDWLLIIILVLAKFMHWHYFLHTCYVLGIGDTILL